MRLPFQMLQVALVGVSVLHCPLVSAGDQSPDDYSSDDNVPLSEDDLREITAQVLAKEPLLSSSPGIKVAEAWRSAGSEDIAAVFYYPHSENAGIKQAFQVDCSRQRLDVAWICEDARIRRYLTLDTQDYEVRITGPIGSNAAIALIEATREALPISADDAVVVPDTAMKISSYDDSATVAWVSFEGGSSLLMKAHLADGGDPNRPGDWILSSPDIE